MIALALSLSLLAGCGGGMYVPVEPVNSVSPVGSEQPEASHPPVELEKVTPNGLVLRLLESEYAQHAGENVILSPLSIEMAMAMAANGAEGQAKEAVETLLGMDVTTLNALLGSYMEREDGTLSLANSVWLNKSMEALVNDCFQNTMTERYHAQQGLFTPYSEADAAAINAWVKEKTREKIDSIVTEDILTDDALAILVNALYFGGKWVDPFEEWQVSDGKFHAETGDQDAQLMFQRLGTYFETGGYTGFAKPYRDGYQFIGILPNEEGPVDLTGLDVDAFLDSETYDYDVDIRIPKFELDYSASLVDTLKNLGLGSLFEECGLSGILTDEAKADDYEAHISDVLHKTYMKMYEEGTEAAAVTAVIVECCRAAIPVEKEVKEVFLDRPFAFLIRDTRSGQVIFCGVINSIEQ